MLAPSEVQGGQTVWPGTIMTGPLPPPVPPVGGPQEGASGGTKVNPGSTVSPALSEGGPQEGVSGETGANPGSLRGVGCAAGAALELPTAEQVELQLFLSIYIRQILSFTDANAIMYHMPEMFPWCERKADILQNPAYCDRKPENRRGVSDFGNRERLHVRENERRQQYVHSDNISDEGLLFRTHT